MSENNLQQVHDTSLFYHSKCNVHRLSFQEMPVHIIEEKDDGYGKDRIQQLL